MRPWVALVSACASVVLTTTIAIAAEPSGAITGCRSLAPGDSTVTLVVDGSEREVLVHVPPAASTAEPRMPLVVAFHGFTGRAARLAEVSQLGPMADADGFVVAYPQGTGLLPSWRYPGSRASSDGVDDLRLVDALLDLADREGCIDMGRVVLVGHSMGGAMAQAAACAMAGRVAGLVLAAAVQQDLACAPSRPVAVAATHALDDRVLPYGGGRSPGSPPWLPAQQPVEDALAAWAERNGCSSGPLVTEVGDGDAVLAWDRCAAPVTLHRLARGGHGYPALASDLVRDLVRASDPMATPPRVDSDP